MKIEKKIKNKKEIYVGIQLLRILFSFHILVFHCINHLKYQYKSEIIKFIINNVAIDLATFFIISFFFSYKCFSSRNIIKIKQRFKRLLIPYIIWPIIFYIINFQKIKLKSLFYQLLIGNGIHFVFWFQFNIIFIKLIFTIIIFLSKKRFFIYLFFIGIICYFIMYYEYYSNFFSKYNQIVVFPIKPINSSYIYSIFGFYLYTTNIAEKLKKYKKITIILCLIILCLIILCLIILYLYIYYKKLFQSYPYIIIILNIICSYDLLILFLIFPFENIYNKKFNDIIIKFGNYSAGIYYLHPKIQLFLLYFSNKMKSRTFIVCIINYLLCNIICFIGLKIFRNSSLRNLFI